VRKLPTDPEKRRRGNNAVLVESDVQEIRRIYSSGVVSQSTISKMFGVAQTTVGQIVRGETWRHVGQLVPDKEPRSRNRCPSGCLCDRHSQERAVKFQATMRGRNGLGEASGESLTSAGYRFLTMQYEHPLRTSGNVVLEHRAVLYSHIGPGPHPCHWIDRFSCGRDQLEWGGLGGDSIVVDHLDDNGTNNSPENLVPSCTGCNVRRAHAQRKGGDCK